MRSTLTWNRPTLRKIHDKGEVVDNVKPARLVLAQVVEF